MDRPLISMVVVSTFGPVRLAEGSDGGIWIITFFLELKISVCSRYCLVLFSHVLLQGTFCHSNKFLVMPYQITKANKLFEQMV
jgi:hypothetical protein